MRREGIMKFRRFLHLLLAAGLAATFSSCASVSVTNVIALENPTPVHRPRGIYVRPFEFEEGTVRVDREGQKLDEFEKALQDKLAAELVARFREYLAPSDVLPESAEVPAGDFWVVTGRFTRINQGSRALRSTIGFGAGGTKLDVSATVSSHASGDAQPFVLIQTTGGSNAMPGAIMGVIAWPMVLQGAQGLIAGVTADARRTSKQIAAALADYLRKNGMDVSSKAPKPKMKGQLPPALQPLPPSGKVAPTGGRQRG
jgi:hypothetical protein